MVSVREAPRKGRCPPHPHKLGLNQHISPWAAFSAFLLMGWELARFGVPRDLREWGQAKTERTVC